MTEEYILRQPVKVEKSYGLDERYTAIIQTQGKNGEVTFRYDDFEELFVRLEDRKQQIRDVLEEHFPPWPKCATPDARQEATAALVALVYGENQ